MRCVELLLLDWIAGDGMLQVVFRFFGPCLGVRHKTRPEAGSSPRIARDTPIARTGPWSRLLRTFFFWRGRHAESTRPCGPAPRITYVPKPPPLSDQDTAKSIVEGLVPLPPEALTAFCARCSKDTLQAMVDWCRSPGNRVAGCDAMATTTATSMIETAATEALGTFTPDAIVPAARIVYVLTQLHGDLTKVCDGKGVLDLARRRDDWVSGRPRDREFLAGGQQAANTFDMFRRSVEALCRFEMADGEPAVTQALARQWREAVDSLRKSLEAGTLTQRVMTEHADLLRPRGLDTALFLIHTQLGIDAKAPLSHLSNDARPDEAAEATSGRIDKARVRGAQPTAMKTLTDLLLDPLGDADQLDAAVDLLVHNLRTVARLRTDQALRPEIEGCLEDLLARAGARLTEPQLHRLGDALQRLDMKAWGTCRKLLDIREALYDIGKQALRDAMAGMAGLRAQQCAVRARAQQIWQAVGHVDTEVASQAGPYGARPRDGAALG